MPADLMQGQLRHVERELLDEIRRKVAVGIEVYAVAGWRGRWVLVHKAPEGYIAGRVSNRATYHALAGRGEIRIGDRVDLDLVAGMTVANGARWAPHPEQGFRLTLPQQTGAPHV